MLMGKLWYDGGVKGWRKMNLLGYVLGALLLMLLCFGAVVALRWRDLKEDGVDGRPPRFRDFLRLAIETILDMLG